MKNETFKQNLIHQSDIDVIFLQHYFNLHIFSSIIEKFSFNDVLKLKKLPDYYDKNLKEHFNFFKDANTTFHLNFIYF